MCNSNRKAYHYTATSSPWNKKFLLAVWLTELILGLAVVIFGAACYPFKVRDERYDDGISYALYICILLVVAGAVGLNLGFLVLQFLWYRKHKLHPGFMVWMQGWNVMIQLAVVALSLWSIIEWSGPKWQIYEVVLLFYCFNAVPYVAHLFYAAKVYHRLRKNRRRSMDVEMTPEHNKH